MRKGKSILLRRLILRVRLFRARKAGLQISDDCRLPAWRGFPNFGSEPYLISIGKRVGLAGRVVFITHDGGTFVFRRNDGFEHVVKYGRITIHDNSVIGYGAILMPGIEIGPNSVVAAGAVVGRSVPPNSLAAGVPARVFMSTDDYARLSLESMADLDRAAYIRDKKAELLRLFPRPW